MSDTIYSPSQKVAYDAMQAGINVFVTGEAGSGKSFIVNEFCNHTKKKIIKVAPTGIAAINIGGATIHRTFGLRTGVCIRKPTRALKILELADAVLIDEASMVRIDYFNYVMGAIILAENEYHKHIQVIMVGDFFQLPPVVGDNDAVGMKRWFKDKIYPFESEYWQIMSFQTVILRQQMRQSDPKEAKFVENLNKVRIGDVGGISYINRENAKNEIKNAVTLAATNRVVNTLNDEALQKIDAEEFVFESLEKGEVSASDRIAGKEIHLKVGARVMTLVNEPEGKYQNGSTGTIIDIDDDDEIIHVQMDNGIVAKIERYKWEVKKYMLKSEMDKQFEDLLDNEDPEEQEEIPPENDELIELTVGEIMQLPLRLAYAVTIHKSQGQTYDAVNLRPFCWDYGQLYVALSRCKHLSTMHVEGFIAPKYLKTDKRVLEFYESQEAVE